MIKGLVFDMDGLLLDSERIVKRSWDEAGDEMGIPKVGKHIHNTLGMNRKARNEYFEDAFGVDFPLEDFNKRVSDIFYRIVREEGLPVKDGARELLMYARGNGYKTAIATSSSRAYAVKVLEDAGLYQYFDNGVFGDMVEHTKPDPEIYLKACESIQQKPEKCFAFEDAPAGIKSAHGAGLKVIAVPDLVRPDKETLALTYRKIHTLREAIPILEKDSRRTDI